jgi:hypothetical protein
VGILDKAKEAAKTVGEKAKEGVEAGKDKADEVKTKRHIADLKEELGGIVYAQQTNAPPANADVTIARIVGEIQQAEAHLAE